LGKFFISSQFALETLVSGTSTFEIARAAGADIIDAVRR
jgi:hypothetical protein